MPGAYDPRRYGPTVSTADIRGPSLSVCAATPREVLVRAQEQEHLLFARTLRRYSDDGGSRHSKLLAQQRRTGSGSTPTPSARMAVPRRSPSFVHDGASPGDCSFYEPGRTRTASTARSSATPSGTTKFVPPQAAPRQLHHQQYPRHALSSNGKQSHDSDSDDDGNTLAMTPTTCLGSSASSANAFVGHGGDGAATGGAGPELRGRTCRRSLSWHCRRKAAQPQRSPASSYSSCFAPSSGARSANASRLDRRSSNSSSSSNCSGSQRRSRSSRARKSSTRNRRRRTNSMTPPQLRPRSSEPSCYCASSSRGGEAGVAQEGEAGRECRGRGRSGRSVGEAAMRRGESIDAEELFRQKNKMATYNVTYRRWAESYDRSTATRAAHERKERLEAEREIDMRRRRAGQEFQRWVRSHAPRSASAAAAPTLAIGASSGGGGGGGGLGPRSSYRERASSASPLRRTLAGNRKHCWKADECKNDEVFSSGVAGGGSRFEQEEEEERKKAREVDRAFRTWLARKKKQAHDDRETQRAREEALARLRKLEASRRWKKRSVVCAYTYGAKVGAREWKGEERGDRRGERVGRERAGRSTGGSQTDGATAAAAALARVEAAAGES